MKVWVVGRGGLLGRSVEQYAAIGDEIFSPNKKIMWPNIAIASQELEKECAEFFKFVAQDDWTIFWCAGRGTLSSLLLQMNEENILFENFLNSINNATSTIRHQKGTIFFASSAGAVYAGSKNPPFTELTETNSLTAYGDAKMHQEELLRDLTKRSGVKVLVGRISNIYGARQDLEKNQGLISTICYSVLRRQPVNLFVPLETSRNYIYVEDAAKRIVAQTRALSKAGMTEKFMVKLIVAPENLTIGGILNIARSVLHVRPLVAVSTGQGRVTQPQSLLFKSVIKTSLDNESETGFTVGLKKVMADLQSAFMSNGWQKPK